MAQVLEESAIRNDNLGGLVSVINDDTSTVVILNTKLQGLVNLGTNAFSGYPLAPGDINYADTLADQSGVLGLNLAQANTWTATQDFAAGATVPSGEEYGGAGSVNVGGTGTFGGVVTTPQLTVDGGTSVYWATTGSAVPTSVGMGLVDISGGYNGVMLNGASFAATGVVLAGIPSSGTGSPLIALGDQSGSAAWIDSSGAAAFAGQINAEAGITGSGSTGALTAGTGILGTSNTFTAPQVFSGTPTGYALVTIEAGTGTNGGSGDAAIAMQIAGNFNGATSLSPTSYDYPILGWNLSGGSGELDVIAGPGYAPLSLWVLTGSAAPYGVSQVFAVNNSGAIVPPSGTQDVTGDLDVSGTISSSSTGGTQVYSTAGTYTYTVPSGVSRIYVQMWGAGGGGGGGQGGQVEASGTAGGQGYGGGGGGGGAYMFGMVPVQQGTALTVTVGAGGTGGAGGAAGGTQGSGGNGAGGGSTSISGSGFYTLSLTGGGYGVGGGVANDTAGGAGGGGGYGSYWAYTLPYGGNAGDAGGYSTGGDGASAPGNGNGYVAGGAGASNGSGVAGGAGSDGGSSYGEGGGGGGGGAGTNNNGTGASDGGPGGSGADGAVVIYW